MMNRLKILKPPPRAEAFLRRPSPYDETFESAPETAPVALPDLSLQKILVPFAFSDTSALLLRRLIPLAQKTGAALHLLHVVDHTSPGHPRSAGDSGSSEDEMAEAAQTVLNIWRDSIVRGRVPVFASMRIGHRVEEIITRAERLNADLIVMTTHWNCEPNHPFYPSTAEKVMRDAPCPVLTIPARRLRDPGPDYDGFPASSWKTLLMPVDFSPCARRVLKYAAALSIENRAKLVLIHIMLEGPAATGGPGGNGEEDCRRLERRGKKRLMEWVREQTGLRLQFESAIWAGIPSAYAMPIEARLSKVDLIVMPVRNPQNPEPPPGRTVTDVILRSAPCPILSIQERMT